MAKGGKSGLDELFGKVFSGNDITGTLASLHNQFPSTPEEKVVTPVVRPVKPRVETKDVAADPSIHRSIHPSEEPAIHPVIHSIPHPSNHPSIHPFDGMEAQSSIHPSTAPATHNNGAVMDWRPLTAGQGKVLLFLLERTAGAANVDMIAAGTGVPVGTVKDGLRALMKYGYITHKSRLVAADFHGFRFTLDHQKCAEYVAGVKGGKSSPLPHPSIHLSTLGAAQSSIHPSIALSSSRDKTSTTVPGIDLQDPELAFWAEQGVTSKRLQTWMEETGISPDLLAQSMRYARFEILERGDVRKPMDWLYAELKKNGCYRKPTGYKSLQEIRLEEERAALEEMQRQIQELAEVRRAKQAAAVELEFQRILAEEGQEYQTLMAQLTPFEREMKGRMMDAALRRVFMLERGYSQQEETHS